MKIINFGSINIDNVYNVEHITLVGETNQTNELFVYPGGKGLNQSIAIKKAGSNVLHVGKIGKDGLFLKDLMNSIGVDTRYVKISKNKTGHAIIQVDNKGNNAIFVSKGANFDFDTEYIDGVIDSLEEGDFLTIQNEINNVQYIIEKAYDKGVKVFFNPSPFNDSVFSIDFNKIYCLIVNEHEGESLLSFNSVDEFLLNMRKKYPKLNVLITLGVNGCAYIDDSGISYANSFIVNAVDTTAAGDTFTGYFISSLSNGMQVKKALRYASCASALCVSKNGAGSSIPIMAEVESALKVLKENKKKEIDLIDKIKIYIQNNIANVNLSSLSKYLGYSNNYVSKIIKDKLKLSFVELLLKIRLEQAENLLTTTTLPVSEIINKVGYSNESYFRKAFTLCYGKSPLQYRKGK